MLISICIKNNWNNPQDSTYEEAFLMAYDTWPKGIRPVCHHSNSRKKYEDPSCRSMAAHSDYYYEPFGSCGKSVDVAMEAKAKELAVFDYLQKFEGGPERLVA